MYISFLKRGQLAEDVAARFLDSNGFKVIKRNFRCPLGEIDLIARQGKTIHFVEVKGRWTERKGGPLEQITPRKMKQISRVAIYYLQQFPLKDDQRATFSVMGVDGGVSPVRIHWVPEAFDMVGSF